jgi:hypothetical protein
MKPEPSSSDLEEYDSDTQHLLSDDQVRGGSRRQQRRNWTFLAVNTFILLLNIGVLLMMIAPNPLNTAEDTQNLRLPHAGQSARLDAPHSWGIAAGSLPRWTDWISNAIELEVRTYDDKFGNHGPFRGAPRPELDDAWGAILKRKSSEIIFWVSSPNSLIDYTLRVPTPGWRNASSPTSVLAEFQDEKGGIMGTFSFLHNLHCLVRHMSFIMPS